jgi:CO/xanthine dehydrogenase FAD-binding subunit
MRSYLPNFEMTAPRDLGEALTMMSGGAWRPFAGGTDLMVLAEAGKLPHRRFLSIWHLSELRGIAETPQHVTLGALTTYTQVQRHPALQREFPLLCRAAAETGGVATQNRGTLGGNIANASPAADSPPALLVYDAELELVSASGSRWVPYAGFHTGYKRMNLRPDELIARIRLHRRFGSTGGMNREGTASAVPSAAANNSGASAPDGWRHYYRKVGTRKAQAISKVCFAGVVQFEGGRIRKIRIALGSVAPTAVRCAKTEALLRGEKLTPALLKRAQEEIAREIAPIDDFRSTARYRSHVTQNLLEEFLSGD